MKHIVKFERGHDCIKFECIHGSGDCKPGGGGSHGKGGINLRFVSKGKEGAVQFLIITHWIPQYAKRSKIGTYDIDNWGSRDLDVMPADLGYHSKKPMYDGQEAIRDSCEFCDGKPCYYDGSGLNASDAMYALVNGGDNALWKFLDEYYKSVFRNGKYPEPTEYEMPLRRKK